MLGSVIAMWPDARVHLLGDHEEVLRADRVAADPDLVRELLLDRVEVLAGPDRAEVLPAAALAVGCVVVVALPFLREPEPESDVLDEPDALRRRQLELAEERDRALAALKELELDHRTGKISDEDYRALVGPLRREAAEALRALEPRAVAREPASEADGVRKPS